MGSKHNETFDRLSHILKPQLEKKVLDNNCSQEVYEIINEEVFMAERRKNHEIVNI